MRSTSPLFENEHFNVSLLSAEPIVIVVRSGKRFASVLDAEAACRPMLNELDQLGRENYFLLLDSRKAVSISDPVYEKWFARIRKELLVGFPKAALVFETIAGKMQGKRLLSKDNAAEKSKMFTNPDQALVYLRGAYRASLLPKARTFLGED